MHVAHLLESHGYAVVFAVLFVESLGLPSPSELTLVAAGALAASGRLSFPLVVVAGALGSFLGAQVSYTIGRRGGRAVVLRYGRRLGLTEARLSAVESFFARYGVLAVVIGRVISGVRALISYPAGIFCMPWPRFAAATLLGSLLWPLVAGLLGQLLGREWRQILSFTRHPLVVAVFVALALAALVWHWRGRRRAMPGP